MKKPNYILMEPDYLSSLPKTHMSIVRSGNYGRGADRRREGTRSLKRSSVESEELSTMESHSHKYHMCTYLEVFLNLC